MVCRWTVGTTRPETTLQETENDIKLSGEKWLCQKRCGLSQVWTHGFEIALTQLFRLLDST